MTIDENDTVAGSQGSMISSVLLEATGTDPSTTAAKDNGWQCAAGANCDKESQGLLHLTIQNLSHHASGPTQFEAWKNTTERHEEIAFRTEN